MTDERLIKKLITAFYNGDTTQEEETILQKFFDTKNISEKWNADRNLFYALHDPSEIKLPKGFSERLENNIDRYIKETGHSNKVAKNRFKTGYLLISAGSIAAAILLLTGIFIFHEPSFSGDDMITDTYTDPREATVVAEKVLTLISVNLNKGFLPLEKTKKSIDKTNELLNKNLKLNN
jgi:hypothetical protein